MKILIYYTPCNQYNNRFSFCYDNKYYYYNYSSIIWFWQVKHKYLDYCQRIISIATYKAKFCNYVSPLLVQNYCKSQSEQSLSDDSSCRTMIYICNYTIFLFYLN